MATFWQDLRFAVRQIAHRPLLCGTAILSLALGIGANATIFSYANAILLRPPAIANRRALVEVYTHNTDPNADFGGIYPMSYYDYLDIRQQNHAFTDIAIYDPLAQAAMVHATQRATWSGEMVSGNYFSLLGVPMALGRGILPAEAATIGTSPVVVISYQSWQRDFGGDPNILGQKILLNQTPFTVVGVTAAQFDGMIAGLKLNFFVPVTMADSVGGAGWLTSRSSRPMFGLGELKPGQTLATASADLTVVQKRLDAEYPNDDKASLAGMAVPLGSEPAMFRGQVEGANMLLTVIVGLVLLIACFNAANVLLVLAHGRRRELAVRAALGASRGRLLRQGLTESILLALLAGAVGLEISRLLAPLLLQMKPPGFPIALNLSLDRNLVVYTAALALGTGVLFGILPAWQAANVDAIDGLKAGASGLSGRRRWIRGAMISGQVAICVVVLVGAALCLRSLQHANAIDPGFDTDHLVFASIDANALGYHGPAARAYVERVEDAVAAAPGVQAVAVGAVWPLSIVSAQVSVLVPGMQPLPGETGVTVDAAIVGPNYFHASGTRLLAGRDFTRADLPPAAQEPLKATIAKYPDYVIVNQTMAERFWPHRDPVGQALLYPRSDGAKRATVLGVAANGKYRSLGEPPRMYVYELESVQSGGMLIRTVAPANQAIGSVRSEMQQLDPNLTNDDIGTARDALAVQLFPVHAASLLLLGFGSLALVLALVGLFAVIASSVAQRTREFGVRMALGADQNQVLGGVLGEGLRLAGWGLLAGLALSALADRAVSSLLYGISPLDPLAYLATVALLTVVALAAAWVPARRAARVDPVVALRQE